MKNKIVIFLGWVGFYLFLIHACAVEKKEEIEPNFFLSEIRPDYFDNLDFELPEVRANVINFLPEFKYTFDQLEQEYEEGAFVSQQDLEFYRLAGMYYEFYLLAVTGTYLDDNLTFEEINGERKVGLYSGLSVDNADYEQLEMEAMMERAAEVGNMATYVNGYNDKAYGFYMAVRQVQERLRSGDRTNSPEVMEQMINYTAVRLVKYDQIQNWNVLMSMVTTTNYSDTINTFDNPKMDELLFHVNARLVPGTLADLGGLYPEILGPLYRFDLNFKKIHWILKQDFTPDEKLEKIQPHLDIMNTALEFMETERGELLASWAQAHTVEQRKVWLEDFNQNKTAIVNDIAFRENMQQFIDSKDFKKAYQCYSCHRSSGI